LFIIHYSLFIIHYPTNPVVTPIRHIRRLPLFIIHYSLSIALAHAQVFRVATFNVENYIEDPGTHRPLKTEEARALVCQSIVALKPDVLALEEMGSTNALLELQAALKKSGLDLPFWDHLTGEDPNIHLALLSRFPILARHPHTNESFLLEGRRFYVSRGFLDEDIQVNPHFKFALIAAHLKSKLASAAADEQELREQEAVLLRRLIDSRLTANSAPPLVVLGDFNDTKDSRTLKTILGRGQTALFDTRPVERNPNSPPTQDDHSPSRAASWTEFYAKEDIYSRIDYILISHSLERDWLNRETYILNLPGWAGASDHRPLVAGFTAPER
jgi:endonuclease/exonuclease/phosphatase family metal-dependent hydrolase